jgi:hypothetical protein
LPLANKKKGSLGCLGSTLDNLKSALEEAAEFLVELVDATGGIDDLLLAGVERMADGAHFNMEGVFAHGGLGHELVAAGASHFDVGIRRMNISFQLVILFQIGYRGFACTA